MIKAANEWQCKEEKKGTWAGGTGRAVQFTMEEDGSNQVGAPPGISPVTASGCDSRAGEGECLPDSAKKKKNKKNKKKNLYQ